MRFKNNVSMLNSTVQYSTVQCHKFKLFKNKPIEKIIKILSVSFGYINRDNLSKSDFRLVINKKYFKKEY